KMVAFLGKDLLSLRSSGTPLRIIRAYSREQKASFICYGAMGEEASCRPRCGIQSARTEGEPGHRHPLSPIPAASRTGTRRSTRVAESISYMPTKERYGTPGGLVGGRRQQ